MWQARKTINCTVSKPLPEWKVENWVVCKDGVSRRQKGAVSVPNIVNPTSALISDMFQDKILYGRIDNIKPIQKVTCEQSL